MGVHNNFPAPSWIKLDGISVAMGDKVSIVKDFKTNLKYVYWSSETPTQLTSSNLMLDRTVNRFLIVINNKGECVQVPNESIKVSFDGNSVDSISEHIWGLHEKDSEFKNKFVSVEQNIDGIKQTVGATNEELGKLTEHVSKIEQTANEIDLSVKELDREYNDNKEMQELRETVNKTIIDMNSSVGLFKSKMTTYMKDNSITQDENVEILAHIKVVRDKKASVLAEVDKVILIMDSESQQENIATLNSAKTQFVNAIDNLIKLVETSVSDSTIVPSEITVIIDAFAKASLSINILKNTIDEMIFLGVGGTVSEELARIGIKSDEISLSVTEVVEKTDQVDKKYADILLTPNGIVNRVGSVETKTDANGNKISSAESRIEQLSNRIDFKVSEGDVKSIIQQSPNEISFGFNDISDYVTIGTYGLDVKRGSIACDSIKASSSNPIIKLFEGNGMNCAIDATAYMNEGVGSVVRLKRDDSNYLMVGDGHIAMFLTGSNNNSSELCSFRGSDSRFMLRSKGGTLEMNSGLWYNSTRVSMDGHKHSEYSPTNHTHDYASRYHNHSGETLYPDTVVPRAIGSGGSILMHSHLEGNGKNLGWSGSRFQQVVAEAVWADSGSVSDIKFKENIHYIDTPTRLLKKDMETIGFASTIEDEIIKPNEEHNKNIGVTGEDLHGFIRNDLKLCEYNYNEKYSSNQQTNFDNKLGFIAQDLVDTKVGGLIVGENEGNLAYSLNNYVSAIAGALQTEISKREELENEVSQLKEMVNMLMSKVSN